MTAYVIGLIDIRDAERMFEYRARVEPTITSHGGRRVFAGEVVAVLEGDLRASAGVVLEFADVDAARAWFDSPDYRELREFRADLGVAHHVLLRAAPDAPADRNG